MSIINNYNNIFQYMCKAMEYGVKEHGFSERKMIIYASHVPLLLTIIDFFPSNNILEFGTGFFSSKIFYDNYKNKYITIEDDDDWFKLMSQEFTQKKGFRLFKSPILAQIIKDRNTNPKDLTKEQVASISKYYKQYITQLDKKSWDVMFVDQIKCGRSLSVTGAHNKANIILYHDMRKPDFFNYQSIIDKYTNTNYSLYCYKTIPNWTGMLVNTDKISFGKEDIEKFKIKLKKNEKTFFELVSQSFPGLSTFVNDNRFKILKIKMK